MIQKKIIKIKILNIKPCKKVINTYHTAQKMSKYGVFSGPYFHVFGLNTEIYSADLRIQSKYGKIRTRKNSAFRYFLRSVSYLVLQTYCHQLISFTIGPSLVQ